MKNLYFLTLLIISFILSVTSCKKDDPIPEPTASFTMDKTTAEVNETITFTNTSQNATSYSWDFGDSNTSTDENPTHAYSKDGAYMITLTVTGEGGENIFSNDITILGLPTAIFSVEKDTFYTDQTINFTNQSENGTTYAWNFGDGITSTDENPEHSFSDVGKYNVTLSTTGLSSSASYSKELTIIDFSGKKVTLSAGEEYEFSYSTWTSFGPSAFSVTYTGDGKNYFSRSGIGWLSYFLIGDSYLSGARFKYKAADSTPAGVYSGKFTITFKKGSRKAEIVKNVMFIIN